ncbi:hypothetical protein GCM10007173_30000 [Glutamicibacter ardleyensis]|uniref:Uncharacterized protein n=1 Tax=Glutamicibacter ardleyensis TaxID=225894 RepID=A0ABQ2DUT3_9MICC|nr:hypothetical protein GCM10007173_30000 [Glutamicibacter ardleyensis]
MDIQTNKGTLKHVGASLASNAGTTSEHPQATGLKGVLVLGNPREIEIVVAPTLPSPHIV